MRRLCCLVMVLLFVSCLVGGCGEFEKPFDSGGLTDSPENLSRMDMIGGVTESVALIAGQAEEIGAITCWIEDEILYVQYSTEGGWTLCETQLAAAEDVDGIPSTPSENPMVGHFPYKEEHYPPVTRHTYSIDLEAAGFSELEEITLSAHADVQIISGNLTREEGAWGEGDPFFIMPEYEDRLEKPVVLRDRHIVIDAERRGRGNWAKHFRINLKRLRGLLLWNKLGSVEEVENSEVGPDGIIVGDIEYLLCRHGYGFKPLPRTGDHNIPDNYIEYRNLGLGPQGCIEFWYLPDWIDWHVGHVVHLFTFGVPGYGFTYLLTMEFNDWQNRGGVAIMDGFNAANRAAVHFYPYTIPDWSTEEPFHIAVTWDGTVPDPMQKIKLFINGVETGTPSCVGDPTFTNWPDDSELVLRLGTRLGDTQGDWQRHNWEGLDGIMDNIKIWSCPKTDFSDRFVE